MSELLAIGTSHKTAPLALREKLALLDGGADALIRELTGHPSVAEAVAISTCNRTELYLVVSDPVEAESHVLGLLARRAAIRPTELVELTDRQRADRDRAGSAPDEPAAEPSEAGLR